MMFGSLIDALIPLVVGTYACLIAFCVIPVGKDREKAEAWHRKWGRVLKITGPLVVLFGAYQLATAFAPFSWQRVSTEDGHASVEFPATPIRESAIDSPAGVPIRRLTIHCNVPGRDIDLRLSYSEITAAGADLTVDQRLDALKTYFQRNQIPVTSCTLNRDKPFPCYRMIAEANDHRSRVQMLIVITPRAVYSAGGISPPRLAADPAVGRFLNSLVVR